MARTRYPTDLGHITIEDVAHHRNGVAGLPFCVVTFTSEGRRMVGIVFETTEPKPIADFPTAVFDRELLGQGVITFGQNSFRGDVYDAALRQACRDRGYLTDGE